MLGYKRNKTFVNKLSYVILFLFSFQILSNAQTDVFKSDVMTNKKPWTHLKFYNDPMNFQFAIVSDNTGGSRKGIFDEAVEKINLLKPEFVMCVGDLIQGYTQDTAQIEFEWSEFNNTISNLESPFFYLPGNHDITNLVMQKEWEKRYGRRYYHFIYQGVLFITMDSNDDDDYSITEEQMNYVINSLKENTEVRWTFIFMHHPIWTYDTNNRFETIENVISDRKYTVFAGHRHRYHHKVRNEHNYYILGTTGGGSSLIGHRFGRFDHITWLTMTEDGPVFANLELQNIHPHDVSNDQTTEMAKSLLKNSSFEHILLTNAGDKFSDATLYMTLKNSTDFDLGVNIQFYHNHDLIIENPKLEFDLAAKTDTIIDVSLISNELKDFGDIDLLQFDWSLRYLDEKYSDFYLEGKYELPIDASKQNKYISPSILQFSDFVNVSFNTPFTNLNSKFTVDGVNPSINSNTYVKPISISESTQIKFSLFNDKNQSAQLYPRNYEKLKLIRSIKVDKLLKGLKYSYFEGEWKNLPDFDKLCKIKSGVAQDFLISDISDRENNFGLVYSGYINIAKNDMYIFRMKADDASKLFVSNKLVVHDEKNSDFGAVFLEQGFHPIEIHYMENMGNERLRMYFKNREEEEWTFMPFELFYYK